MAAVELTGEGAPDPAEEMEGYCRRCLAPVGLFPSHGLEYRHYRRAAAADGPRQYPADHDLVLGWRHVGETGHLMS